MIIGEQYQFYNDGPTFTVIRTSGVLTLNFSASLRADTSITGHVLAASTADFPVGWRGPLKPREIGNIQHDQILRAAGYKRSQSLAMQSSQLAAEMARQQAQSRREAQARRKRKSDITGEVRYRGAHKKDGL